MPRSITKPCVLTIGGSDCCCGAGIQADLKVISSQGCYGLTVLTCVIAEVPDSVVEVKPLSAALVARQIGILFEAFPIQAIKTGLLYSSRMIQVVAETLTRFVIDHKIALVVDPVMVASTGTSLVASPIISAYKKYLIPLTTLITPNLDELSIFADQEISNFVEMRQVGLRLAKAWGVPLLLKGGHLHSAVAQDLLVTPHGSERAYSSPFQSGVSLHGTGCTFSAAIASQLALGNPLEQAIRISKKYMDHAISSYLIWGKTQALEHFPNQIPSSEAY